MIGHAPSDHCELPVRSMDFNGNTWKKTHLEEPEGRSKPQTLYPELSKLLDADIAHNDMTVKENQTKGLVHPTSIKKAFSADRAPTECTTSADPRHGQNEEVLPEPQSVQADKDTTSSSSSLADSVASNKSKSEESNILSLMLQTVSNIGSVPTNSRTSHSRRKKPATKNHRKNDKCSNHQEIGNTELLSDRSSPVELEMSCEEDVLDEPQLNVSSQYSEAIARYKEEMNIYVQEMERYLLEKHNLNNRSGKETDASMCSTPPDAFVKFSRGVQATPSELSENILINPAVELDLSSSNGKETTEEEESYQHELSERSTLLPSASPLTIPTTQTRMHLTHSAPRNRFHRSSAPEPSSVAVPHSIENSAGTQVLAELEKVCDQLPGIPSQFSPSVNQSVSNMPVATTGRVHAHDRSMRIAGFSSPPHPDVSVSQHNHHISPPVSLMQQKYNKVSLPPQLQMPEKPTGKNVSYQQHRGVKRSHPSSNTSPANSCSNGQQSPEDASRIPDQSPTGYLPPFQPFPGVRPFHHTYPPTAGLPEGCNLSVRPCGESNVRFPNPTNMRFPESNSLRFPEPHSFRFHEPNNIRFPEPSSMKFPEPSSIQFSESNGRFPEPSGMRFPFPPYRGSIRPHNHVYPPGNSSVRIEEPRHVHPSSSSVNPASSRSRRKSSGNQQPTSPVVSLPHNVTVSQGSHTIKYRPDENVTAHFERTYQEIIQRHSKNPSYDVRVRHPWQRMQIHPGGTRPGLQPAPRTNFLREKLTAPPSPWLYNKHPLAQNALPRMHQQAPYSDFLSGNMRGPSSFNPQIPSSMSEWLDCSPGRNMLQDSRPNLIPPLPGSFDHQNALHPLSQTDSASASPSSLRPSPLNPISPVDAVQNPRGTQNTKQPSSVQLNRQAIRGFNHLPPLISISEPNSQTQIPVPSQQLSPKGIPRSENGPSVNSLGYIVQSNAPRMPQIANIQSFAGAKDVSTRVTGPNQGQQEPVMPKIARVHSADPSDEQVLDLSQHAECPVDPHSQGPLEGGNSSSSGHLQTKSGSAMGSSLCRILQGMANLTESPNRIHAAVTSSSSSSSLPVRNHELLATSATIGEEHDGAQSALSPGFSSSPSNQGHICRTLPVSKSSQEKILSVPDVTARSKSLPRIALTGAEYQPTRSSADTIGPSAANYRRSHPHKRKKKHEHRSSSKSKKKRSHHSHEREMETNFPAVLKIPDVKKAFRESATMTHISSEERSSTNSSSETLADHEITAVDPASNSSDSQPASDSQPETNAAHQDPSESIDTSVSTVQSSSVNVSVTNAITGSSMTVVSPSVSGPVMPTPTPCSDALVKLSRVPVVAPPRPIILQTLLTPRIVLPTNITVVQQRNIVVGPVLQVSTNNQASQSLSIIRSAENGPPLNLGNTSGKNPEVIDMNKSLSVLESPKKVNQEGTKALTLECYEETLEQGVIESSSGTTETSPTMEDITVTLPVPDTSVPSSQGEQQHPPNEKQTESCMASEETNLFDRVATYMSNLEKQNSKHEKKTPNLPEPKPKKVSITPGRVQQRMKESVTSGRLNKCTLRLVPRKNKDGGKMAGNLKLSQDERPPTSRASIAPKDKIIAAKWDKYYGYRKGRLPQHQHNTRFRIVCYHCENMMSDNVTYMEHVESVIEKSCPASKIKQLCKICFQTMSTTDVSNHVATSHPVNGKYCCKICNINFPVRKDFKFHMKRVHKGLTMPYVCKICLFQTSFHADLKEHFVAEHRGSKALLCHFCTKILYSSRSFLAHFTKHYAKESGVSCPDCILLYLSNSACKEHLANDHQTFEWNERDGKPKHDSLEPLRKLAFAEKGSRKVGLNITSKDDEDVIEITDDDDDEEEEEDAITTWKCLECGGTYAHLAEHLITEYSCQNCNYYTHCSSAYTQHVVAFHSSFQDAPVLHPVKKSQVFGGYLLKCRKCGFKTSFATNMSEHIVSCPKGVSILDSFPYLREKALSQIALKENQEEDTLDVPEVISVEKIN